MYLLAFVTTDAYKFIAIACRGEYIIIYMYYVYKWYRVYASSGLFIAHVVKTLLQN